MELDFRYRLEIPREKEGNVEYLGATKAVSGATNDEQHKLLEPAIDTGGTNKHNHIHLR